MTAAFVDSNVLVYHLAVNHPDFSPRSTAFIMRLSAGETRALCTSTVIMEVSFVLERLMRIPRTNVANDLTEFVSLPAVEFDFRESLIRAIAFWKANGPLSLPDAYHLVFSKDAGLDRIYTFDRKMNRYPGVERIEP